MDVSDIVDRVDVGAFEAWFKAVEPRLRAALVSAFGGQLGREAAAVGLAHAWEHRDRVLAMANPAGFVYRVGHRWARRERSRSGRRVGFLTATPADSPFEPGLGAALASLSVRQRQVAVLCVGYGLTHAEAAALLGISLSSVQNHSERGLRRLRERLGEHHA